MEAYVNNDGGFYTQTEWAEIQSVIVDAKTKIDNATNLAGINGIVENAKRLVSGMDKAVKYCLSHPAGKLEILTKTGENELLFRFHEAKDPARCGQVFRHRTLPDGCWLPDELTLD